MNTEVLKAETTLSIDKFVERLASTTSRRGFFFYNESKMELAKTFNRHGVSIGDGYDLHLIQLCKPEKGARCLVKNPERGVLLPKFVVVFSQHGKTQIRFLRLARDLVASLIDDAEFPATLDETYNEIIAAINEAL